MRWGRLGGTNLGEMGEDLEFGLGHTKFYLLDINVEIWSRQLNA